MRNAHIHGKNTRRALRAAPLNSLRSCGLPGHLRPGYLPQIVRQDSPTYPPLHPFLAVIEAYIQPEGAAQHADPTLYSRPKAQAPTEPALLLVVFSLLGELAALGERDAFYSRLPG